MKNLPENIKAIRCKKGIQQKDLANMIGVKPSMLCQVETGIRLPSLAMLFDMAKVLNCSLDELTGFNEFRKED